MRTEPLRIANCSGFFGDRFSAAEEMVEGGPIDVLTGDYLAELTMMVLWKTRERSGNGYAATFLRQLERVLGTCVDRRIKIVVNAGGLDPAGLAAHVRTLAGTVGVQARVAHIEGDDLIESWSSLRAAGQEFVHLDTGLRPADAAIEPITANAYLGGWGIAAALRGGADIVICPRVSDASLVVGPAAWAFDWQVDDWDRVAGAVAAGHVIECGPQATGGNYSFFSEIPRMTRLGFPIAEIYPDGSSVITKHPDTGGAVTVGTVTAQLLYEIGAPEYLNPDVVAHFDTIELAQEAPDRVRISGVQGSPAPDRLKVCVNYLGGHRQTLIFMLTGLDVEAKAALVRDGLAAELGGFEQFDEVDFQLSGSCHGGELNADAITRLIITFKDQDPKKLGRRIFAAATALGVGSYPGLFVDLGTERASSAYGVLWPTTVDAAVVPHRVVIEDEPPIEIDHVPSRPLADVLAATAGSSAPPAAADGADRVPMRTVPLGTLFGARSGDKGGNANVGVWARGENGYAWLRDHLTVEALGRLMPETAKLRVTRAEFPRLRAVNFVVHGLLGDGVASSTRVDPQAKGLGEFLRSRMVDVPESLLREFEESA